jgi:hypothetical protein
MDLERYGITGIMEDFYWPVVTYSRRVLAMAPNMEVKMLEQLCVSLVELRLMTGVELCDLEDG